MTSDAKCIFEVLSECVTDFIRPCACKAVNSHEECQTSWNFICYKPTLQTKELLISNAKYAYPGLCISDNVFIQLIILAAAY